MRTSCWRDFCFERATFPLDKCLIFYLVWSVSLTRKKIIVLYISIFNLMHSVVSSMWFLLGGTAAFWIVLSALISVLSLCHPSWMMRSRLIEIRSFQTLAKQHTFLKINLISWARHYSRITRLWHKRGICAFLPSSHSDQFLSGIVTVCPVKQINIKSSIRNKTPKPLIKILLLKPLVLQARSCLSINGSIEFLIGQDPRENRGCSETTVMFLWKIVLYMWGLMSYLKHSYETHFYNSIMKKDYFCQAKVFDSVTDRAQFVKISSGYLESEVQPFSAQNGLCCA